MSPGRWSCALALVLSFLAAQAATGPDYHTYETLTSDLQQV